MRFMRSAIAFCLLFALSAGCGTNAQLVGWPYPRHAWADPELTALASEINRIGFDGKLDFEIMWFSPIRDPMYANNMGMTFHKSPYRDPTTTRIFINSAPWPFGSSTFWKASVVAHEMVHVSMEGEPPEADMHGTAFQRKRREVEEKLGFHILTGNWGEFWLKSSLANGKNDSGVMCRCYNSGPRWKEEK